MKAIFLFRSFLALVAAVTLGLSTSRGAAVQSLTWTGTTNDILALHRDYALGAVSSSGLPVVLRVEHGPGTLAGQTLSVSALGTVVVSAVQAGDGTYNPARLTRSFNVRRALVTSLGSYRSVPWITDLELGGGYAYVAESLERISVVDLKDPARPSLVGRYDKGHDIELAGEGLYVLADGPGFEWVSLSDPSNPRRAGGYAGNERFSRLRVDGNYAYGISGGSGLVVFDVRDPQNPTRLGAYPLSGAYDFQVAGGYAYVAANPSRILSLKDPQNPQPVSVFETQVRRGGLSVSGGRAYLAEGTDGLQIVDVHDPLKPVKLGECVGIGAAYGVAVSGDYAYLASGAAGGLSTTPAGPFTPFEPAGLAVIDVSDPAIPIRVGGFENYEDHFYNPESYQVRVVGNIAYLTGEKGGLKILGLRMGYPQTVEWTGATNLVLALNQPYPLSAIVSSDLPVKLRVESGPATLYDGKLTATGLGTVVVSAEQEGDEAFLPVRVARSFNVRHAVLTRVGSYGGVSQSSGIDAVGRYVYIADSTKGLEVVDISDPASPTRVGGYHTGGSAEGVQVVGHLAFVAAGAAGLKIIDVSDPANPTWVGAYRASDPIESIQVLGHYVYTGTWQTVMLLIDVSNPASPKEIGSYHSEGTIWGVQVVGDYAYVVSDDGLQTLDVSDPSNPVVIGGYPIGWGTHLIHVFGDFAYIVNDSFGTGIFDVRNPANPTLLGWFRSVNSYTWGVQVFGAYAYIDGSEGLEVYDVNDPTLPVLVGHFVTSWGADQVQVVGDYVYMPEQDKIQILRLDWGCPQNLTWTGTTNQLLSPGVTHTLDAESSSGLPVTLRVENGPAVLADGILTVTNVGTVVVSAEQVGNADFLPVRETKSFNVPEARLTFVGGLDTSGSAESVQVVGRYGYVADGLGGLRVIDISDPTNPIELSAYDVDGFAFSTQVVGDLVYVSVGDAGFRVIDISNPLNPVEVGRHMRASVEGEVQVAGKYAYVASFEAGLEVFDVSNPGMLTVVGRYDADGPVSHVKVAGGLAFLASVTNGLQVIDVRDPASLTRVGQYFFDNISNLFFGVEISTNYAYVSFESSWDGLSGWTVFDVSSPDYLIPVWKHGATEYAGVQVFGNYAYVRDETNSLVVYDVSLPAKPLRIGGYRESHGYVREVQVVGNLVYVAAGEAGLQILEMKLGYRQVVERRLPQGVSFQPLDLSGVGMNESGLPLSISVVSGPAEVVNGRVVFTGAGSVVLRVEQTGDGFYWPVSEDWSVRVTPPEIGVRVVEGDLEVRWSAGLPDFRLQVAESLSAGAAWVDVRIAPKEANGHNGIRLNPEQKERFFRLVRR